jgi:uncharacterized protein (DUF2062 family)
MFIALTPTVGFQMILVILIGTAINANRIIALILCWISNPLTFLPMYYGYYYLGAKILGRDLWIFSSFSRKMEEFLEAKQDLGYMGTIELFGSEFIWPLWVGSLILALVAAIPCYPAVLYAVRRQRRLREERRRARREAIARASREAQVKAPPVRDASAEESPVARRDQTAAASLRETGIREAASAEAPSKERAS